MATSTRHVCRTLRQITRSIPTKRKTLQTTRSQASTIREFSSATWRLADDTGSTGRAPSHFAGSQNQSSSNREAQVQDPDGLHESEYLTPSEPYTAADLSPQERADYELLSKPDQAQYLKLQNHFKAIFDSEEGQAEIEALADQADREIDREGGPGVALEFPSTRAKGQEVGYWAEDEEDEFGAMEDADNDWSDEYITTVAESELDLHRDLREYTRIAAWDLPLLQKFAKPFHPPTHSTPLRFRYTTHMGESHPSQSKVVLELSTKDLLSLPKSQALSESQRVKLIKLAGVRYNPSTDVIKMSCEKFPSAAQNKRYLGDVLANLIKEAKDKRDMFTDVAFDFRHHKEKKRITYPEEWKLKKETVKKLEQRRGEMKLLGEEVEPVNGNIVVEGHVRLGAVKQAQLLRV